MSAKLELRRHFLRSYHADDLPNVLDCCQGSGHIWSTLGKDFNLAGYWGLDQKKKKGRVKLDSSRVLGMPGWPQNVIDIDTYGVPWKHWLAMLPNIKRPLTVFLTLGRAGNAGGTNLSREESDCLGMGDWRKKLNGTFIETFGRMLGEQVIPIMLAHGNIVGKRIVEAKQAVSRSSNAQYIGLRIVPQPIVSEPVAEYNTGVAGVDAPAARPKRRSKKETGHV